MVKAFLSARFLVILVSVSSLEASSIGLFNEQLVTSETPATLERATEPATTGPEVEGKHTVRGGKPSTLLEAITGKKENTTTKEPRAEQRLDPDRPHLPESSTTVGKGRIILEGGYTINEREISSFSSQNYPEAVLRIGMLAEWFEFRIGQSFLKQESTVSRMTSRSSGAQDLYLGVKFAITEQKRYLPEIALIPQMTLPTGNHLVTAGRTLPGVNIDGTWEIVKDRYGVEFVVGNNRVSDNPERSHFELATGFTNVFQVTHKLEAFGEWDAFYPTGGHVQLGLGARHYAVGGLVFFATKNFAVDFRAGAGLNAQANRFLIGTGFAFRH